MRRKGITLQGIGRNWGKVLCEYIGTKKMRGKRTAESCDVTGLHRKKEDQARRE